MGIAPEPRRDAESLRGSRRSSRRLPRRAAAGRRSFVSTLKALDQLATSGARVAVRITDLDRGSAVLAGDDHETLPVAGLGIVPLLIDVAAGFESGALDPLEIIERSSLDEVGGAGVWQHLKAPALPLADLAVLAAATGDALAANALIARVGLPAVRARIEQLGLAHSALLDAFRDARGPDDAPHVALGSARELSALFAGLVNSQIVSAGVSAQVSEWLSLNHDLSLVAAATGLDPFSHENDEHGLLFVNKTGQDAGIRAEAGVLAGPRAGVSYALIVCFDDLSITHRLRAHDAFRTLGVDLMEYVF
ncbi:class A beta-lactamase-related serine hydrolase [Microbacterium sp. zg.B48]|uniref:class A beta-lactamase-related serine hydrolase n=1 Tax=unclassified Microbacterium TaxID=2609290 RepID=UPI00214ABDEE|nr:MULTISPECIES: class A beta-lactamase-related serine hydrolase [unclassified Microbacterium]MCR2762882.1 class A beta-lactamase-related serine hydrolase [Microbacterium sp. zg.B48]MCR2808469.1 class A beta-lactamase-related serine hydrolase [Microbacterium sp. zg.B185]WIM19090.1 serine hydrolase [Microbacterium sp. zg-B185]